MSKETFEDKIIIVACGSKSSICEAALKVLADEKCLVVETEVEARSHRAFTHSIIEMTFTFDSFDDKFFRDTDDLIKKIKQEDKEKSRQQIANMRRYHNRKR